MEKYQELLNLVEEVRGLLRLDEQGEDETGGSKGKKIKSKFKGSTKHNPFQRLKKGKRLGPAVRGSDRTPGKKADYWSCRCHGYRCLCKGAKGEKKTVRIGRSYKTSYNAAYRKWRQAHAAKYKPGKGSKWRMSAGDKAKAKLAKAKAKAKGKKGAKK